MFLSLRGYRGFSQIPSRYLKEKCLINQVEKGPLFLLIFHSELANSISFHDIWSDLHDSSWFSRYFDFCPRSCRRSVAAPVMTVHRWFFRKCWATSGGRNFWSSYQNHAKPSPNENINSELSFGGGFMQFRPLAQKLRSPEVGHLGAPRGACPHKHIPSWSGKICWNFTKFVLAKWGFIQRTWFLYQMKALCYCIHRI